MSGRVGGSTSVNTVLHLNRVVSKFELYILQGHSVVFSQFNNICSLEPLCKIKHLN